MKNKIVLCVFILMYASTTILAQTPWELKKDTEHIKIYTRSKPNTKFDEFKAVTTLKTTLKTVLNELLEAPKYDPSLTSGVSYYVKQLSEKKHVFYAHKILPWPVKDRDIVTLLTVENISETKVKLVLEGLPLEVPEKQQTIRIKQLMGYWLLEEINNTTKVIQQLYINPEGTLPSFVVNALLVKGPFQTFKKLKALENQI
ncbi:hypothetical protein ACKGJY_10525 [Hyunsoonleella sp. 2307UL5-6]|uniref:hypothetical protein n=1 Tax=Hyunsoonleella sp. 2307UL5-6 TaxID=3384768 RepID=UPI0039BCA8CE